MTDHTTAAQAAKQDPIREAISILTADAASIRESHTPLCDRDDWNSEPETKAYYDRLLRVAGELSKLRAAVADERVELPPLSAIDAEPSPHGPYEVYESEYVKEYARSAVLADRQQRAALASAPVAGMKPLEPEFAKVLSDNFDSLMVRMPSESALVADERAGNVINAADSYAEKYQGDDRQDIGVDVRNAFMQGAAWASAPVAKDMRPDIDLSELAIECGAVISTDDLSWTLSYGAMRSFCMRARAALSAQPGAQKEKSDA